MVLVVVMVDIKRYLLLIINGNIKIKLSPLSARADLAGECPVSAVLFRREPLSL